AASAGPRPRRPGHCLENAMRLRNHLSALGGAVLVVAVGATVVVTRGHWQSWLSRPSKDTGSDKTLSRGDGAAPVKLSPQAIANLRLTSAPLETGVYWRTLELPGTVIDKPGLSDRGVTAPTAGAVAHIHVLPGDTVRAGQPLFTLRLVG